MNSTVVIGAVATSVALAALVVFAPRRAAVAPQTLAAAEEVETFTNGAVASEAPPATGAPPQSVRLAGQAANVAGSILATANPYATAAALAGQVADVANKGVRKSTEALMHETGMQKDLQHFQKRQDGYDLVTHRIDDAMVNSANRLTGGKLPIVSDLARGITSGIGDVVHAPVEIAALLDSSISREVTKFKLGDNLNKTAVVLRAPQSIVSGVLFDGIGGGLADVIAKTPAQRAKADEVLHAINPSNLHPFGGLVRIVRNAFAPRPASFPAAH